MPAPQDSWEEIFTAPPSPLVRDAVICHDVAAGPLRRFAHGIEQRRWPRPGGSLRSRAV